MLMSVIENEPSHAEFLKTAHPIGRYGEPAEIGETAAWLLSDASSFVTGAAIAADGGGSVREVLRSEEHTSELQSLMRISYAVFCLKKKNNKDIKSMRIL